MKRIFTLSMLCIYSLCSYSQDREKWQKIEPLPTSFSESKTLQKMALESCWGIPFGSDIDSVKKIVKSRTGKVPSTVKIENVLTYKNCRFGTSDASEIYLLFYKNIFYGSLITFKPEKLPDLYDLYQKIKSDLTEKYFRPQKEVESYKYPYEKGDGHEGTAISAGYATIGAIWEFQWNEKNPGNGNIVLSINSDGYVSLQYRDGFYSLSANKEDKIKSESDY